MHKSFSEQSSGIGVSYMRNARAVLCLFTGILLTLLTLGCGSNDPAPIAAVNPTANPLVAQYSIWHFHQGLSAWVEFGPDTNYGRKTSALTSSVTTAGGAVLNILVAGMKAQTTYHMRAHVDWATGSWVDQDRTFTTGALPSAHPAPTFDVAPPTPGLAANLTPAPGVELFSQVAPASNPSILQTLVTDLKGDVIWYYPMTAIPVKPMENGHFILNLVKSLREIDLSGKTITDVPVTQINQSLQKNGYAFQITGTFPLGGFHHDVLVLPNGHWIGLGQTTKDFTDLPGYPGTTTVQGDVLVDIDPTGNVVWAWSSFDHLDVTRHPYFNLPDWTHSNALIYTQDGNILLSVRNQSWILKIDYANGTGTGNILWKLGEGGDFALLGGDPSQWFYAQHFPNLLSTNGTQMTLAIWDNGDVREISPGLNCGNTAASPACYSRATIFQVDEATNLATLVWQDLPGFYSFWGGSIGTLSNGDVEFDMSEPFTDVAAASQVMEVTQTSSPQTVWQMKITGANAYRAYRIPSLYPGVTWQQ